MSVKKLNRYQSVSFPGRPGFIVNVYDPLSFDIDLPLTESELKALPEDLYRSTYLYKNSHKSDETFIGKTFRFRLAGITFRKDVRVPLGEAHKLHQYTWSLIHSCDNWVLANVVGIDTYSRLLGVINIPKPDSINYYNLGNHLEEKFPDIIQKYIPYRKSGDERNSNY